MEKIILLILSCTCLLCKVDCQGQIKQKLNSEVATFDWTLS